MSDQTWYVFQNAKQIGPFNNVQLGKLIVEESILQDAFLFKTGWADWRPIGECIQDLEQVRKHMNEAVQPPPVPISPEGMNAAGSRRHGAPRASTHGRIIIHNNGQLSIGSGVNISVTGIFVETREQLFDVGEQLKLSVRCDGMSRPFNVVAEVTRYNANPLWPIGYGLRFADLSEEIKDQIEKLVADQRISDDQQNHSAAK